MLVPRICYFLLGLVAHAAAESTQSGYVCNPSQCSPGGSSLQSGSKKPLVRSTCPHTHPQTPSVGAILLTPAIAFLPGTYTSTSPLADLIARKSGYLSDPLAGLVPFNGSSITWLGTKPTGQVGSAAAAWPLVVTGPRVPTTFANANYAGAPHGIDQTDSSGSFLAIKATLPSLWSSMYIPPSSWVKIGSDANAWVLRSGGVPIKEAMPGTGQGVLAGITVVTFGSGESSWFEVQSWRLTLHNRRMPAFMWHRWNVRPRAEFFNHSHL